MPRPTHSILSADTGRAQTVALGVLCFLAMVQMLLVARTFWLAGANPTPKQSEATMAERDGPNPVLGWNSVATPPLPGQLAESSTVLSPPSWPSIPGLDAPPPGVLAGDGPLAGPAPSGLPTAAVLDAETTALLETVRQLRDQGEVSAVLDLLKASEGMDQNQPAVLREFAATYEQMGLTDKAAAYWQRIVDLGPRLDGEAYAVASQRLSRLRLGQPVKPPANHPATPLPLPSSRMRADGAVLAIGDCQVLTDAAVTDGERRVLRIPIVRTGAERIEPMAVNLDVFFYDQVDGGKVEPTRADKPIEQWVAAPVDWEGEGVENLDVPYFLPKMTEQEIKNHGRRSYHGYVIKLYYQNRLQDVAGEPNELLETISPQAAPPDSAGR